MPNLHQTLRETDLDFLQRIARHWRIDLISKGFTEALEEIESKLVDEALFAEVIDALPADVHAAWQYLVDHEGKETWSQFSRQFGDVRAMGLAKRERIAPDETPVSACESLWYKALIGRAFLRGRGEPQEFAYIPDEFLQWSKPTPQKVSLQPRPATDVEIKIPLKASDRILDDAADLLAALRMGRSYEGEKSTYQLSYNNFILSLSSSASLLTQDQQPDPMRLKEFLSAKRSQALNSLFQNWLSSAVVNDLRMLPGLVFEGNWSNDPTLPRQFLMSLLRDMKSDTWWSISSLVTMIKEGQPDFQRSAGDYDSWFIRDAKNNLHLQGVKNWDKVEGALLRYLIAGPLHWLGVLDLGFHEKNSRPTAFRISNIGSALLAGTLPPIDHPEDGVISVKDNDTLIVPVNVPRAIRYQIARFGEIVRQNATETSYRITPGSLKAASDQGLLGSHLITLLQQSKVKNIPPAFTQQIERWEKYGVEAEFTQVHLLRLLRPEILPLLQKNPRAARFIVEVLNSKTVVIQPGSVEPLRQILAEMGFLADVHIDGKV